MNLFQNDATYDWEFYIKEKNKGDLKQYVERINIELHETFENPKRGNFSQGLLQGNLIQGEGSDSLKTSLETKRKTF